MIAMAATWMQHGGLYKPRGSTALTEIINPRVGGLNPSSATIDTAVPRRLSDNPTTASMLPLIQRRVAPVPSMGVEIEVGNWAATIGSAISAAVPE